MYHSGKKINPKTKHHPLKGTNESEWNRLFFMVVLVVVVELEFELEFEVD